MIGYQNEGKRCKGGTENHLQYIPTNSNTQSHAGGPKRSKIPMLLELPAPRRISVLL